jgi:hypothetical protein
VNGIGSHHSARADTVEWLTPPEIVAALGPFDLDPCSPRNRPWDTATTHYTKAQDGLSLPWVGRIWLNPPYGLQATKWLKRLADHGNGIAILFARTETDMFFRWVWEKASAVLFIRGRLHFHRVNGERAAANAGGPSVLIAYGAANVEALRKSGIQGRLVVLEEVP